MEILLTIIGFLGLGALLIAAWVFASAARRYVSGEEANAENEALDSDLSPYRDWTPRSDDDRRRNSTRPDFPIIIDGERVERDRRQRTDRRGDRRLWVERSTRDRRRAGQDPEFPITVEGEVIEEDRRRSTDRRSGPDG